MQRSQTLIKLLKQLAELVAEEAEINPAFAEKLAAIIAPLPKKAAANSKTNAVQAPDVYSEFEAKGSEEFSFWLRTLDVATLKAIIKSNGFDPGKNSTRWTEPEKLIPLIVDQVTARLKRGSAFLSSGRSA